MCGAKKPQAEAPVKEKKVEYLHNSYLDGMSIGSNAAGRNSLRVEAGPNLPRGALPTATPSAGAAAAPTATPTSNAKPRWDGTIGNGARGFAGR